MSFAPPSAVRGSNSGLVIMRCLAIKKGAAMSKRLWWQNFQDRVMGGWFLLWAIVGFVGGAVFGYLAGGVLGAIACSIGGMFAVPLMVSIFFLS